MKTEMSVLAGEITVLRTRVFNGSSDDDALRATCAQLALENEDVVSHGWEVERQLVSARREEAEVESSLRNVIRDKSLYVLKSEHEPVLKRREDELVADMRKQLSIGYSDMRQRTTEAVAVETTRAEHRK